MKEYKVYGVLKKTISINVDDTVFAENEDEAVISAASHRTAEDVFDRTMEWSYGPFVEECDTEEESDE